MSEKFTYQVVRHYKDGEPRDVHGRWTGKMLILRTEHYALMQAWQEQSGMKKAQFWREAALRGAVELARMRGIPADLPPTDEIHSAVRSSGRPVPHVKKKRFLGWLFRKSKT